MKKLLFILWLVGLSTTLTAQEFTLDKTEIASVLREKVVSLQIDKSTTIRKIEGDLYQLKIHRFFDMHLRLTKDTLSDEIVFDVINNPYMDLKSICFDITYGTGHPEKVTMHTKNKGLFIAFKEFKESLFIY